MSAEDFLKNATEKMRTLLEDAEREAADIIKKAREDAEMLREEGRMEARQTIASFRDHLDNLEGHFGIGDEAPVAKPTTASEPAPSDHAKAEAPEPPAPAPAAPKPAKPEAEKPKPAAVAPPKSGGDETSARLVAMQMALDGSSRDDVAKRIKADYGINEPDDLVSQVFERARK